jgi:hypothetical protein
MGYCFDIVVDGPEQTWFENSTWFDEEDEH